VSDTTNLQAISDRVDLARPPATPSRRVVDSLAGDWRTHRATMHRVENLPAHLQALAASELSRPWAERAGDWAATLHGWDWTDVDAATAACILLSCGDVVRVVLQVRSAGLEWSPVSADAGRVYAATAAMLLPTYLHLHDAAAWAYRRSWSELAPPPRPAVVGGGL